MREGLRINKYKTNHYHRLRSFTHRSEQPPLLLCSPDPTPEIAGTCYVTAPGPEEARGCRSTSRESMRQRRPGGKSELRSRSCCLFSSLSIRDDTIGLVIYFPCSPRFFKEEGSSNSGKGDSLPLLLSSACCLSQEVLGYFIHIHSKQLFVREAVGPFSKAMCQLRCSKAQGFLWKTWCRCRAHLKPQVTLTLP